LVQIFRPRVKEIKGTHAMKIPLLIPSMPTAEELLPWLRKIDENRWYTNYGPLNTLLERELAARIPGPVGTHLTTVANCTLGLELALSQIGLAAGARVLIPAITFVATGTAVLRAGFTPVIADVAPDTWLLTPEIARQALAHTHFDAVMPVSTFGRAQDTDAWDAFSEETGAPVVIDAAGAMGNQGVGRRGLVVYSLHATKSLGCGEGGAVAGRDAATIARIRQATNFGIDLASPIGESSGGTNAKLSEYHAAVGLASLPAWERNKPVRQALHRLYRQEFACCGLNLAYQSCPEGQLHTLFIARLPQCPDVAAVVAGLAERGIGARRWYCPPLNHHRAFAACPKAGPNPVSESLGRELIGLPFFPGLGQAEVETVGRALRAALTACAC
jgi:dTDP-4-amino-4,6-dideoxygalactose transaminase